MSRYVKNKYNQLSRAALKIEPLRSVHAVQIQIMSNPLMEDLSRWQQWIIWFMFGS